MLNKLRALITKGGTFDDGDVADDDNFLDDAFGQDESLGGIHGLVGGTAGRIPFKTILPTATFLPGYEKRGAPVMNPTGLMIHWTASRPSAKNPAGSLPICRDGRTGIPGPLCQIHIDFNGKITVIASGRANHAGKGDQSILAALKAGTLKPGRPGPDTGGSGGAFIGIEVEHSGDQKVPYPPAVLASIELVASSIKKHYGWNEHHVIDHARWTRRKIDCVWARPVIKSLAWLK